MSLPTRAVVVHRASELDRLVERHATRGQVEFFLRTRGRTLAEVQAHHDAQSDAIRSVSTSIPADWRRGSVERADLHRFDFGPEDVVIVVGPDGLVANVAKYLSGQPVIGVDPEPGHNAGVLVRHLAGNVGALAVAVARRERPCEDRTMVRATLDDGASIDALNDLYVGHASHQSSRYRLTQPDGGSEVQSSSGLVVTTGTGSTGWAASLSRGRPDVTLPGPTSRDLAWFVREAWPSPTTGVDLTFGTLAPEEPLDLVVHSDALVVFGDGVEEDRLTATWGQTVRLTTSDRRLRLVV